MQKFAVTLVFMAALLGASFFDLRQERAEALAPEQARASSPIDGMRASPGLDEPPFAQTSSIIVVLASDAPGLEERVSNILCDRIRMERRSPTAAVSVVRSATAPPGVFSLFLGRAGTRQMDELCQKYGVELPGKQRVAPEGFALKTVALDDGSPALVAVGADGRGVLYAVGEILRRLTYRPEAVAVPALDMQFAPAYRFRGSSANQGGTMRRITGARAWTDQERHDYVIEQALAGANTFYAAGAEFDFVKEYELMTVSDCRPNEYRQPAPKEWQATGCYTCHEQRAGWICPSVPKGRTALLDQWEKDLSQRQHHDVLRLYAGDPGGCRCPRCKPWGKTFILLSEEIANLWLKHHPNSIVQIANQDLSNEGDQAIFDYLNEKPRLWLEGIAYGPGSNAMSPYFRTESREDLFEYPGVGPVNRYLAETLNQLPKHQKITHYSDLSHWISAQYQVEHPEPNIVKIYGRRTFHTRPRAFYDIFQAIMPFSEGDIIYSEGYHDELHQWMWNRLLWNPNQSLEAVLADYFTYFMGPEYVEPMSAAALQLEKNLEAPLATNDGVDRMLALVKEGGKNMPDAEHLRPGDHRFLEYLQKAELDKYFQLKLRIEQDKEQRVAATFAGAGDAAGKLAAAKAIVSEPNESPEMATLREDARVAGEAGDRLFGVRNVGYFSVDKPLTNLEWTAKQIDRALGAPATERGALLAGLAGYEDPGPGGFYDDAGNPARQPHLVRGDSDDGTDKMDPDNRPSQNTFVHNPFSLEDPGWVVFRYTGLDSRAQYRLRATLVLPRIKRGGVESQEPEKLTESILADDICLVRDVEIPVYTAGRFEYDVPQSVTSDGRLEIKFEPGASATGVVVSEIWLLRK